MKPTIKDEHGILRYSDEDKLTIFIKAKEYLKDYEGLCATLDSTLLELDDTHIEFDSNDPFGYMDVAFPEIYRHKPNTTDSYWFGSNWIGSIGYNARMEILDTEINILKYKLNIVDDEQNK